jgi:hypothetical protein
MTKVAIMEPRLLQCDKKITVGKSKLFMLE